MYKKTKKYNKLKQLDHILRLFILLSAVCISIAANAQSDTNSVAKTLDSSNFALKDTIKKPISNDSIKKTVPVSKNSSIESTINYSAKDSIRVDVIRQKVHIYGQAHVDYGEITLDAAYIEIDWSKNLLSAKGRIDSSGNYVERPKFKQGGEGGEVDSMAFNFQTQRGLIHGVVTEQGGGYIQGETVKKNKDGEMYIHNATYSTCNLENPHFYIKADKMKMVPEKLVVSGPFHIVLSDIPTPIGFIFGLFPIPKENSSGIIQPSIRTQATKGVGLSKGGYYWAVNDYLGVRMVGDIFANGSWRAELSAKYNARYRFQGDFAIGLSNIFNGFNDEDKPEKNSYMIRWKHTETSKKNSSFSANVQMQSANYIQNNSVNFNRILKTDFSSNIRYTKRFGKSPFSMSMNMSQNQNAQGKMNFRVPDVNLNMTRRQPFKRYRGVGSEYIKNFAVNYNGVFKNSFSNIVTPVYGESLSGLTNILGSTDTPDTIAFSLNNLPNLVFENGKYGYKHSTTIQNNFKALKYFTVNPNLSYEEIYYDKKLDYEWVESQDSIQVNTIDGMNRVYNYSMGVNLNTVLYSFFAIKGKRIPKIRNMMRPQIGYRYRPDFSDPRFDYYQSVVVDTQSTEQSLSRYNNFSFTTPGSGNQNLLTWSLANNIEIKFPAKNDSAKTPKPFRLLNFNLASNYNFTADSLKAAPLSVSANTKIKGFDINYSSNHSFYEMVSVDSQQVTINQYYGLDHEFWQPLRTTRANFTVGTSFNPAARKKKLPTDEEEAELTPSQQAELDYIAANPGEYIDFNIPWNIRLNYNLSWSKPNLEPATISQAIRGSGNLSLSKKWKVTFSSTYNMQEKTLAATNIGIVRDLHCWEMSFDWIPTGRFQSIQFTIRAKSALLQALEYTHAPQHYLY